MYKNFRKSQYNIPRRRRQYVPSREIRDALFLAFNKSFLSPVKTGKHCAVLLNKNNEIIKTFVNCHKECPGTGTIHAEVGVIKKTIEENPDIDLRECTVLVVRGNLLGSFSNSAPCDNCLTFMKKCSIGMILYTSRHDGLCVI